MDDLAGLSSEYNPERKLSIEKQEAEIQRLNAEKLKFTLESEEIQQRLNPKWHTSKAFVQISTFSVAATLLLAWFIHFMSPLLESKSKLAEITNEINAKLNERARLENDSIQHVMRLSHEQQLTVAEERASQLSIAYANLKEELDSILSRMQLTEQERNRLKAQVLNLDTVTANLTKTVNKLRKEKGELIVKSLFFNSPPGTESETLQLQLDGSKLPTIYFESGRSYLDSGAKASLDSVYKILQRYPSLAIKIQGHTDFIEGGRDILIDEAMVLGEKRAQTVMVYLIDLGTLRERLSIVSYGKESPAYFGLDDEGCVLNARCELIAISR